ncbi:hypothetical protein PC129_g7089 [Phytophthora cactorum]|uniref:Uncharacterized protein n=1 Tax=Phytophthora cactorum TaxID=29920 RepID=A0A8T1IB20_9STRA|nr:hypothetical protein Pcac1_g10275 [Phytophthora cactorum]KAG3222204.1 hypothetical protein PC129_g7089 [Phytophthora cactorum]
MRPAPPPATLLPPLEAVCFHSQRYFATVSRPTSRGPRRREVPPTGTGTQLLAQESWGRRNNQRSARLARRADT